ncbi:MAG: FkbM family methyltransferase [Phycisphaerae bacterium]|jgi:FkbM family methyltransferase|nr:FkbM family methyltransferase [Phycisphaerae bacterium]
MIRPILEHFPPLRIMAVAILKIKQRGAMNRCGLEFELPSGDFGVTLEAESTGEYEPVTTHIMQSILKEGMTFVDIGAHVGLFTLPAAKWVGKNGRVVAFEPHPDNFEMLSRNAKTNGLQPELINAAVSNVAGSVQLHASAFNSGDHQIYHSASRKGIAVDCIKLDEFFSSEDRVDLIKMDVQGAESAAFHGMERLLRNNNSVKVIWELSPSQLKDAGDDAATLLSWLESLGFGFTIVDDVTGKVDPANAEEVLRRCPSDSYVNILSERNA